MSKRPARLLPVVLALVLAAPLAACGDDAAETVAASAVTPAPAVTAPAPAAPTAADSFPVTVEQVLGNVTIPAAPTRVVALDFPSADALLALGVVPVAMARLSYIEGGVQSWTKEALAGRTVELFDTDQGFPFETIARIDPDLIVATNTYPLIKDAWGELNAIAPVVGHVDRAGLDPWQDGLRKVAKAVGRTAHGDRLVAATENMVAAARAQNPGFAGRSVSFFNYVTDGGLYVISSNDDVSMRFVRDLGFAGAPQSVLDLDVGSGPGDAARAQLSPERYELLEADVVLGTSSDPGPDPLAKLTAHELFARVPAVARGAFVGIGIGPATAMAFPSALSVPYALREVVPQLAAAQAR
jgi:iron complex transport system substrate-binding protein